MRTRAASSRLGRRWRAVWRDTALLLREFRATLIAFSAALLICSGLYDWLSGVAGAPTRSYAEALYHVLSLSFLQPLAPFPEAWYLQVFYFLMPLLGASAIARGVAEFGVLFLNRQARGKEWQMAVASTFENHVVLVGLGHLGYRVVWQLLQLSEDVVVIERNPNADLLEAVRALGVPVLEEDGTREAALVAAGVPKAHSIVLSTQMDSQNLQMAVKARSLNPAIHVVIRIFDEDFAQALHEQFQFDALSSSGMSAPAFAAAAAGVDMTRPITVEGASLSLARLCVQGGSTLHGMTVGELERDREVSVVLLRRDGQSDFHPGVERALRADDLLGILGEPEVINQVVALNSVTGGARRQ